MVGVLKFPFGMLEFSNLVIENDGKIPVLGHIVLC